MKANFSIVLNQIDSVKIELWDADILIDDFLTQRLVNKSGDHSILFESNTSGEVAPELELRIIDNDGKTLKVCTPLNQISAWGTFRADSSCVEFGQILI